MVTRVCHTLNCSRAVLNVCASPRSVVYGVICFLNKNSGEIQAPNAMQLCEHLIPDPSGGARIWTFAPWAVVVEKHAIYQTLCSQGFLTRANEYQVAESGLLITVRFFELHRARDTLIMRRAGS